MPRERLANIAATKSSGHYRRIRPFCIVVAKRYGSPFAIFQRAGHSLVLCMDISQLVLPCSKVCRSVSLRAWIRSLLPKTCSGAVFCEVSFSSEKATYSKAYS